MINLIQKVCLIAILTVAHAGFSQKPVKIQRLTEKKLGKIRLDSHVLDPISYDIDEVFELDIDAVVFELAGCGPYGTEKFRTIDLHKTDSVIATFGRIAELENIKTIVFKIGEGKFLTSSDNLVPETEEYDKKQSDLNYERFVERYQAIITTTFQGKRVIYVEWKW